jgi:hypothetical protein
MWDKLFALFNKDLTEEDAFVQPRRPEHVMQSEAPASINTQISKPDGQSVNIGYNYLKGLDEDESNKPNTRRFINLNKLLRGQYNGQITPTDAKSESNVRGENPE